MKAVSLFSGGLDSQLAIALIKGQGIDVEAINFKSPFFGADSKLPEFASRLGIPLTTLDISEEYMDVLKHPRYGYGKNMNPCIDCHGFMIRKAGEYMHNIGASFIVTGEVLGQRPMSQNRSALDMVDKLSGFRGLILRPLCALLLQPTVPETEGWVNRELLLDINGRSRTRQTDLAAELGITDFPSPAGGCMLTNESFARRLKCLSELNPGFGPSDTDILKLGRHFLLDRESILVVGRKASENEALIGLARPEDFLFKVGTHPGPTSLLRTYSEQSDETLLKAASITARYSDAFDLASAGVKMWHPGQEPSLIQVKPIAKNMTPETI